MTETMVNALFVIAAIVVIIGGTIFVDRLLGHNDKE
jgi:hypothetical protein